MTMNVADSEVVAAVMKMAGYDLCEREEEADAVFLNTCSVRENAENKIYHRLEMLHAERKKGRALILGVLGCMAQRVKEELIDQHHANLVCGRRGHATIHQRDLSRYRALAHERQQGERFREHHARLQ